MTAADLEARCAVALAARDAAVALRDLAEALDVPADVLAGDRGKARLVARGDRARRRLHWLTVTLERIAGLGMGARAEMQWNVIYDERVLDADVLTPWAAEWDRFADEVDP